jgi:hypothetical protein
MKEIIDILEQILVNPTNREALVKDFQKRVGDPSFEAPEKETKICTDLAYKMENYEPEEEVRMEDSSLFGDDKLIVEVEKALGKLNKDK